MKSSATGTVKAVSFWDLEIGSDAEKSANFKKTNNFPAIVIAIRGSASLLDHMVNANGERRDAGFFFVSAVDNLLYAHLAEKKPNRQKKRWES